MEIERKFTIKKVPDLSDFSFLKIEQAYLNINPVVRIRRQNEEYYLTYKGKGMMAREEYNLPLNKESFYHLLDKVDGQIIKKTRYLIPFENDTIELDVFEGSLKPLIIAEVEFKSERYAYEFTPPEWFDQDVTMDYRYHNSYLSKTE